MTLPDDTLCIADHPLPRFRLTLAAFLQCHLTLVTSPIFFASADLVFA